MDPNVAKKPIELRLCGARTRRNTACRRLAMACGRCRMHGGLSTGPRTAEGLERIRVARTIHGRYSAENRTHAELVRELKASARRVAKHLVELS